LSSSRVNVDFQRLKRDRVISEDLLGVVAEPAVRLTVHEDWIICDVELHFSLQLDHIYSLNTF
jgi:hypothetical protein